MSFLPIVERELRTAARKPSTYRVRTWFVIGTSGISALLILLSDPSSFKQTGNPTFQALFSLAFLYCLLAGTRLAADCLSEEKREGTLGLLFLTDLRGYDVVLGKLVAVSARTFQGLFAFFPVLALGLVLGGLSSGEFWRATALLSNALFFSVCVSLFVSALSRASHLALTGSVLMLAFLTVTPPLADWLLSKLWPQNPQLLRFASPAGAAALAYDLSYQLRPAAFWGGLAANHAFGWSMLLMASIAIPRSWQEKESPPASSEPAGTPAFAAQSQERASRRRGLLDINPILWLAGRHQGLGRVPWVVVTIVAAAGCLLLLLAPWIGGSTFGLTTVLASGLRFTLKLWIGWQACATLAEARRTGAVELLLATPLRVDEIIHGHWQALKRMFLGPVVAALVLSLFPVIETYSRDWPSMAKAFLFPVPALTVLEMVTFIFDLLAMTWVGMWMGLSQPKLIQAYGRTVLLVVIIPMLVFCLPNILFDLLWIAWARRKLEHSFRDAAFEKYEPQRSGLGTLARAPESLALPPVIARNTVAK